MSRPSHHVVYLHGFASSVRTAKGRALSAALAADVRSFRIADLEGGDFPGVTMCLLRDRAVAAIKDAAQDGAPVIVVGSSLGGYISALIAADRAAPVASLVLVAPAFRFPSRWRDKLGEVAIAAWRATGAKPFFHHGVERDLPLGYAFYESCVGLPDLPGPPGVPVAIVHGRGDDTVPWHDSLDYVERHPGVELHLVEGDHRLTEPRHEALIAACVRDAINWRLVD